MHTFTRFALALALVSLAPGARAGVNLRWDHCLGDAGVQNKNFACNTNSGTDVLVTSFVLNADLADVSGQEIVVDLVSQDATLPAWWAFKNPGTCRQGALGMNTVLDGNALNCVDWASIVPATAGIGAYNIGVRGANTARIIIASAVPLGGLVLLSAGQEYFSANITFTHAKTVGAGACAGCTSPACLVFTGENVTTPVAANNVLLFGPTNNTFDSYWATWQGGPVFPGGGVNHTCPFPVPTKRKAWGELKALYR